MTRCTLLALWLFGFCAGCGDDGGAEDAGRDAGRDAGTDAGIDAGWDASRPDAAQDAGRVDAGAWGTGVCSTARSGGGFERVTWLPDRCRVTRATEPGAALGRLCWQPCRDGRAGCQELVTHWHPTSGTWFGNYASGAHDGVHGYFFFNTDPTPPEFLRVVARDDGRVLAAWRDRIAEDFCWVSLRVGETHGAAFFEDGSLSSFPVVYAPWSAIASQADPTTTLTPAETGGGHGPDFARMSDRFLAVVHDTSGHLTRTDSSGTTVTLATAQPVDPFVVESTVLFTMPGPSGFDRIMVAREGSDPEVLREVPGASVRLYGADARGLVWIEASERLPGFEGWGSVVVYQAAFVTARDDLEPRRVVRLPDSGRPSWATAGFGHLLYAEAGKLRHVDLATAEVVELVPPEGHRWLSPVAYSGPDDFVADIARSSGMPGRAVSGTILRIRHDSVGEPMPPEGPRLPPDCPGVGCRELPHCPARVACAEWSRFEGMACGADSPSRCLCSGLGRCIWECRDGVFHPTDERCSELGVSLFEDG